MLPPGGCVSWTNGVDPNSQKLISIESTQDMNYQLDLNVMQVHITGTINCNAHGLGLPVRSW
jgi:hypothetical protein